MAQTLGYASGHGARPASWIVRGYWIWTVFPAALRIAAEIIYQQSEVRDDWPTFVGPGIALASIIWATALFLIGCVGLARGPTARRQPRVWFAWIANAAMALAVLAMPFKYMFGSVLYKREAGINGVRISSCRESMCRW